MADLRRLLALITGCPPRRHRAAPIFDFTPWAGQWVAVKDGVVIASSPTARELVHLLGRMGGHANGAAAHFVSGEGETDG